MLALDRPLGVIDGLVLFGDHVDPKRVYYSPTRPVLARVDSQPELAMVRFRSDDATDEGAALLSFTTELVATDAQLEAAKDHLEENGVTEAVLGQFPWVSGSAVFAAALAEGDGFVERLYGDTTPDLAGSNRAVFSAMLNEDGAALVEGLLDIEEGANPLGVRYELEYLGLRPAFDVRLRADYSRLYDEFAVGFQLGVAYQGVGVRAGVESATQSLIESGAIEIDVLHFTDDRDLHERVDATVRWFQDHVVENFFTSRLQPKAHQDLGERALAAALALGASSLEQALQDTQLASQLAQQLGLPVDALRGLGSAGPASAARGGESTFALNLQFELKDIRREELSVVTLDWSEARAERRTAAPQGLLMDLGAVPDVVVATDDDTWDRLTVNVRPLGDFVKLGVDRLIVDLAYPDEDSAQPDDPGPFIFDQASTEAQRFAVWTDGGGRSYRSRTTVHFGDDGPWPGAPTYTGPWTSRTSRELGIHPLEGVPRVEVAIEPGTVDFDHTPHVSIDFRVDGIGAGSKMISGDNPTAVFRLRLGPRAGGGDNHIADGPASDLDRVEYRPTWFMTTGPAVEGDWTTLERSTLLIHRPYLSERTVRLFPLLPDDFLEAVVTVSLPGDVASAPITTRFDAGARSSVQIGLPSLAEMPPPAQIHVLIIRGDGTVFEAQIAEVTDPVVMITDRDGRQKRVTVRLIAGEQLSSHGVIALQVQLLGADDAVTDSVAFSQSNREPTILLAPIEDDNSIRYRVVRFMLDGSPVAGEVIETDDDQLLIQASA